MKQTKIFKAIFANKISFFALCLGFVFTFTQSVFATIDFTTVLKSTTNTTAVVTFTNKIESAVGGSGEYLDMVTVDASVVRLADSAVVARISTFTSHSKESKDLTFSTLSSGTAYEARFTVSQGQTTKNSTVPFTTKGATAPLNTKPQLPVSFLTDKTTIQNGAVTLTVGSTATTAFQVNVIALSTLTGNVVADRTTTVGPNATAQVFFTTGLRLGETYDFLMLGKKSTDPNYNSYQTVSYKGLKVVNQVQASQTGGGANQTPTPPQNQQQTPTQTQVQSGGRMCVPDNQCRNCIDDNGDGKSDYDGNDTLGASKSYVEPDPSCFSTTATHDSLDRDGKLMTEKNDDIASSIIPCTDKCTFSDVFKLINNLLTFFIRQLLIPIFIFLIMWAGYKYITAQGNASKKANLKKIFGNMVIGIVLILCSWLIVHTILVALGYTEGLLFFQ